MPQLTQSRLILFAVILGSLLALIPTTDTVGAAYVDTAFKRALLGFAVARGLNGVISVAQGTEVAIQPAGVGVSFTPGEILDPVNDLVERFSWIMLLATSSLGVQKVLLSMSAWQGPVDTRVSCCCLFCRQSFSVTQCVSETSSRAFVSVFTYSAFYDACDIDCQ